MLPPQTTPHHAPTQAHHRVWWCSSEMSPHPWKCPCCEEGIWKMQKEAATWQFSYSEQQKNPNTPYKKKTNTQNKPTKTHKQNKTKRKPPSRILHLELPKPFLAAEVSNYPAKSDPGQYLASAGWRLHLRYRVLGGHGWHRRGQRGEDSRSQGHCRGDNPWHPIGRLDRLLRRGNHRITRLVAIGRVIGGLGRDAVDCGRLGEAWGERERTS